MAGQLTLFDLPSDPEQIGVVLPPANLRRIDFSALDFSTGVRSIIEYIKTYYPDEFNDFVASNAVMMLAEIVASNTAKLSLRSDMLSNEAFLPTALTEEAVYNHLALINQSIKRQTPAVVDIEVTAPIPLGSDTHISPGLVFQTRGPDNSPVYYELFRAPGDFTSDLVIPAGKRGVIGYGIEGRIQGDARHISTGGANQVYTITADLILDAPLTVAVDGTMWLVTKDPIEKYGPNDQVVHAEFRSDHVDLMFGDNMTGKAPLAGQEIAVTYRIGGGVRGRIASNAVNESRAISPLPPLTSPVQVTFRNPAPSSGGTDHETLEQAKKRAPRDFAAWTFTADRPASIVTSSDYAQVASTFAHPVFGAVAKAVATVRTGLNANLVELYTLSFGPDGLVTPSAGLKRALATYIDDLNVITDSVVVLDGLIKTVDLDLTVVVHKNADATFVKNAVTQALDAFFDVTNRDLGQPMHKSEVVDIITSIDGVSYVDVFKPVGNVLASNELANGDPTTVGLNEIIVEGSRDIKFFYAKN